MWEWLLDGLHPRRESFDLDVADMALRAAVVYVVAVALVRLGSKRFMGRNTAFDLILGIMLGSVLSRGITGNSPLLPVIAAGAVLVASHWVFAFLAYRFDWLGPLIKGTPRLLVKDGKPDLAQMRGGSVGEGDLEEALRKAGCLDVSQVKVAHLERSGEISIIQGKSDPKVVEVDVREGVQRVRIELE